MIKSNHLSKSFICALALGTGLTLVSCGSADVSNNNDQISVTKSSVVSDREAMEAAAKRKAADERKAAAAKKRSSAPSTRSFGFGKNYCWEWASNPVCTK